VIDSNTQPILLVEDNPDDVELTRDALAENRIANPLIVATDGAEALAYLATADPLPKVVLLDLKLPKVDGLEVLQKLRQDERTRNLAVVVLTTSSEESDLVESYRLGANSYVRKPVDFVEFHDAVKTLGLFWLLLNETPPQAA
jgi:two-component system response regulator